MLEESTLKCIEIVVNTLTGLVLFWLGYEANQLVKIQNKRLSPNEKKVYLENYHKISKAFELCIKNGGAENEALSLMWSGYDEAKLQLPDDIVKYTEKWLLLLREAWGINRQCYDGNGNPRQNAQDKWGKLIDRESHILKDIYEARPVDIYRKYIAVS
jgi:hypothetical protein